MTLTGKFSISLSNTVYLLDSASFVSLKVLSRWLTLSEIALLLEGGWIGHL